jgi:hypothetical protein
MKPGWIFLDVDFDRHKVLVDEGCELRVSVRFGFQPSACPSGWSGAEVNQHGLVLCLRLAERIVYVFVPRNRHHYLLKTAVTATANWMLWWIFRSLFYFSCKLDAAVMSAALALPLAIHSAYIMQEGPWVSSAAIIRDHFIGNGKCANRPILQIVYYKPA